MGIIQDRLLSLSLVFGVCFLLLVSLVISAAITAVSHYMSRHIGGAPILWDIVNFILSLVVITLLFAMLFRELPDARMSWSDVWIGAGVTAILFEIGKVLLAVYLGRQSVASAYGAAGSFVILLLWIYYSSLIFLLGAQFTHVFTMEVGSKAVPTPNAIPLTEEARNQQGIPRTSALKAAARGELSVPEATGVAPITSSTVTQCSPRARTKRFQRHEPQKAGGGKLLALGAFIVGWILAKARSRKHSPRNTRRQRAVSRMQRHLMDQVVRASRG
jgi:hypothetical protein